MRGPAEDREDDAGEDAKDGGKFFQPFNSWKKYNPPAKAASDCWRETAHDDGDERIGIPHGPEIGIVGHEQREEMNGMVSARRTRCHAMQLPASVNGVKMATR